MSASGWQAVFEGCVLLMGLANILSAGFFWQMRATYVSKDDLAGLENKFEAQMKDVFEQLDRKAAEVELRKFDDRLRNVEQTVAVNASEIRGVRDIMLRVEHQVSLLVQYRMEETKP